LVEYSSNMPESVAYQLQKQNIMKLA